MANRLALRVHLFLLLCKRDEEGVAEAGGLLKPGQVAEAVYQRRGYSLMVLTNPKVGSKTPPSCSPFDQLAAPTPPISQNTRVAMNVPLWLQPIVFWRMASTPESANQMAFEHGETGCFKSWRRADLAIIIRCCIMNTFTISQRSDLVPPKTLLWDLQCNLAEHLVPGHFKTPA